MNVNSYVGKDLRDISNSLLKVFPNLHEKSKTCQNCRKSVSKSQKTESHGSNVTESNYLEDVPENESLVSSVIESEVEHESPMKKSRISREEALEELLNRLTEKFNSLPENSPMRKTILTIAPDCWCISYSCFQEKQEFGRRGGLKSN